jgi:threonine dehydratase
MAQIYRARARLRGVTRRTPLVHSEWLSACTGVAVHLKLECWQITHSFKLRGAYNAVAALDASARARGLVTASAGNHGQALALAARLYDARATIFVPESAPRAKQTRIARYGAEVRPVAGSYDDAAEAAREFASERGATIIHSFNDPDVVAGQGTVGTEIVEELPQVRTVVVPIGGGGLAAGVGVALKSALGPRARVLGVQSTETVAMHAAFVAGSVVPTPVLPTLCDGLAGETEPESYERVREVVDSIHLVAEHSVAEAIRLLFQEEGVVAEGSGAVGVAAALEGLPLEGPTAIVVSGGNIDRRALSRILAED